MLLAGLLFSLFFEYVNIGAYLPVLRVTKIGTIVPLLVFVLALFKSDPVSNGDVFKHANSKWLFFLLFLVLVSVISADVTLRAFDIFRAILGYVFWYVIIVKVVTDIGRLKQVFKLLVFAHALILMLNPAVIIEPATRSYLRAGPFLGDGNDFALSVCIVLPMCLVLLNSAKTLMERTIYLGALGVMILAIVGTQSRGGTLALAGVLGFLWWSSARRFTGLVVLGILFLGVVSFAPPQYFERIETIANYQQEGSAQGRITAWKTAVRMAAAHPLTGVGAGHFPVAFGSEFRPPEWGGQNLPWMTAHSIYFLVLGELGLPGIIFLLSLLVGNFFRLRRLRLRLRGSTDKEEKEYYEIFLKLSASVIAFAIGGAFLSATYYPHIFVIAGLITASTIMYERAVESRLKKGDVDMGPQNKRGGQVSRLR